MTNKEKWVQSLNKQLRLSRTLDRNGNPRYIVLLTGEYITSAQAMQIAKIIKTSWTINNTEKLLYSVMASIEPLTNVQLIELCKYRKDWAFLNWWFKGKFGQKIDCDELFDAYCEKVNQITKRAFYPRLQDWANENKYNYRFFNRRSNRKLTLMEPL